VGTARGSSVRREPAFRCWVVLSHAGADHGEATTVTSGLTARISRSTGRRAASSAAVENEASAQSVRPAGTSSKVKAGPETKSEAPSGIRTTDIRTGPVGENSSTSRARRRSAGRAASSSAELCVSAAPKPTMLCPVVPGVDGDGVGAARAGATAGPAARRRRPSLVVVQTRCDGGRGGGDGDRWCRTVGVAVGVAVGGGRRGGQSRWGCVCGRGGGRGRGFRPGRGRGVGTGSRWLSGHARGRGHPLGSGG
jgi:hypothetical protein